MTKQNFSSLFYIVIFSILFFILKTVNLSSNDFYYLAFSEQNFSHFIESNLIHYKSHNGRFIITFLTSFFLSLPLIYWQIFNAFFITFSLYFIQKICKTDDNIFFSIVLSVFLIFSLDSYITNESIFNISGSMDYIYPLFIFLFFWFLLEKNSIFLPLLAIFSAQSTEQYSLATLIILFLYFLKDFIIDGKLPSKSRFISIVISILGFLSLILSPKTLELISEQSIIDNFSTQLEIIFFSKIMLLTHIIVLSFILFYSISQFIHEKTHNKTYLILVIFTSLLLFNFICGIITSKIFSNFLVILAYFAICFVISYLELLKNQNFIPFISIILAITSQFILIQTSVNSYNNALCLFFMLIVFLVALTYKLYINAIIKLILIIILSFLSIYSIKDALNTSNSDKIMYSQNTQAIVIKGA